MNQPTQNQIKAVTQDYCKVPESISIANTMLQQTQDKTVTEKNGCRISEAAKLHITSL
ncbi:hypothetical protein [Argonema galeatum]|uniref:hypothetical protein n=1 Tax=Argonema galeatum TaxID=2942762 RepID=UPI00201128C5|nr:hypothetical protein [Argonema galeatum]MCL1466969.1 hypothetical protein [Argonema galeatum A003/A1]